MKMFQDKDEFLFQTDSHCCGGKVYFEDGKLRAEIIAQTEPLIKFEVVSDDRTEAQYLCVGKWLGLTSPPQPQTFNR